MTTGVLIAVRGNREGSVASAIGSDNRLAVTRRCADLAEAVAAAEAGHGSVVLVSEQPQLDRSVVAQFLAARVAVVGVPGSSDAANHLRALGIVDLLPEGANDREISSTVVEAVRNALAEGVAPVEPEPVAPVANSRGSIIAVWGPAGAPGRTTVAVNLATELAENAKVLLIDADTYGGAVAQALGLLDEAPGLAAIARASLHGTLTGNDVARHALAVGEQLRVLTGITRADRWPELSQAALDPVWELLREHADYVVVDCGFSLEQDEVLQYDTRAPQRNGATLSALAAADLVVAVGSSEPLGIQRLVHGMAALDQVQAPTGSARLVVANRLRVSVVGLYPQEAVADVLRRYSNVEQVWVINYDSRACDAATLAGQTLKERAPRSQVRKDIQAIARGAVAAVSTASARASV